MTTEEADASVHLRGCWTCSSCMQEDGPTFHQLLTTIVNAALTSNDGKEEEHDGVEEAETQGQGILVDHSGDHKDGQHGSCSEFPVGQLQGSGQERRGRGLKSKLRGQRGVRASGLTRGRR